MCEEKIRDEISALIFYYLKVLYKFNRLNAKISYFL